VIDLIKISSKKNPADTKIIPMKKFPCSLKRVEKGLLGGSHVNSQDRGENSVNNVEANFYKET